jgi:predicted flap endonuclease-1-like 5' DNA nuclease
MSDFINAIMNRDNEFINSVISHMADSFMSIFIFGVVTGWLIEWLFYYFIWRKCSTKKSVKKSQESSSNSASKAPTTEGKTAKQTQIETKEQPTEQKHVNELTNDAVPQTSENTKNSEAKVEDDDVALPQETDKIETSKDKLLTAKEVSIKAKTVISETGSEITPQADDFTKIVGIGPSISKYLNDIGVDSFKKLSTLTREELIEKLSKKGVKLSNKGIMASWADQAKLADAGDVDGLVALQNKLKNG